MKTDHEILTEYLIFTTVDESPKSKTSSALHVEDGDVPCNPEALFQIHADNFDSLMMLADKLLQVQNQQHADKTTAASLKNRLNLE